MKKNVRRDCGKSLLYTLISLCPIVYLEIIFFENCDFNHNHNNKSNEHLVESDEVACQYPLLNLLSEKQKNYNIFLILTTLQTVVGLRCLYKMGVPHLKKVSKKYGPFHRVCLRGQMKRIFRLLEVLIHYFVGFSALLLNLAWGPCDIKSQIIDPWMYKSWRSQQIVSLSAWTLGFLWFAFDLKYRRSRGKLLYVFIYFVIWITLISLTSVSAKKKNVSSATKHSLVILEHLLYLVFLMTMPYVSRFQNRMSQWILKKKRKQEKEERRAYSIDAILGPTLSEDESDEDDPTSVQI